MNTTTIAILIIFLIVAVLIAGVLIYTQVKKLQKPDDEKSLMLLQNQIGQLVQQLDQKLTSQQKILTDGLQKQSSTNTRMLQELSKESNKTIKDVTERLTKLDETNKRVVEFATQLQSLENILKNPKQRGILGEFFLEDLLSKVMPQGTYKIQYKFADGEIVDAAIFVKDKIIPIDAKFSLEKYNEIQKENDKSRREELEKQFKSDLKARIDETSKYIRTDEGTTDFALMFIPAEGIFYNLLAYKVGAMKVSSEDLINYAFKKGVVLVSPNTFYAYLQTILQALKALQVEESVQEVIKRVAVLGKHLTNYQDHIEKVGKHLGSTVGAYNRASKEFTKVDKDVLKISGVEVGSEQMLLEKPEE
ncbi:DNA recombination protein RmuC [Candidatus Dojkabacteria bacterium]|nr:DNA recombination protein RmuC [Candidatus Dojkabacteria bacterium]